MESFALEDSVLVGQGQSSDLIQGGVGAFLQLDDLVAPFKSVGIIWIGTTAGIGNAVENLDGVVMVVGVHVVKFFTEGKESGYHLGDVLLSKLGHGDGSNLRFNVTLAIEVAGVELSKEGIPYDYKSTGRVVEEFDILFQFLVEHR